MIDDLTSMNDPALDLLPVTRRDFREFSGMVDQRFEAIDQRFEAIDQRFEAIDQRFEAVDRRFDQLDQKIDDTKNFLGVLIEDLRTKLELTLEILSPFADKVTNHEERITAAEEEISILKNVVRVRP
ncbi:MAG: hypothetical protein V1495_00450 [Pseudomonadota bacterium]